MPPFTAAVGCQGIKLKWGTTEIGVTNMQYSRSAAAEIDMTSMGSTVVTDMENTSRKVVKKSVDFGVIDMGELSCEFYGPGAFNENWIGMRRSLTVTGVEQSPSGVQAFLTQISTQIVAGDLVKGSCTFKLSDTV